LNVPRKKQIKPTKAKVLLEFISKNPGLSIDQISGGLGWTRRSVKLVLGRLEKKGQISTKYFPIDMLETPVSQWGIEKQIRLETSKLDTMLLSLKEREKETFEKCVEAQMARDENLASMYANQCAEIRKLIDSTVSNENLLNRIGNALEGLKLGRKLMRY
jgi:division protein CdvB (Snf7/Vps24/ESCRT-III family)